MTDQKQRIEASKRLEDLLWKNQKLSNEIIELKKYRDNLVIKHSQVCNGFNTIQSKNDKLRLELTALRSEVAELKKDSEMLEKYRVAVEDRINEKEDLMRENQRLRSEVEALRETAKKMIDTIEDADSGEWKGYHIGKIIEAKDEAQTLLEGEKS